MEIAGNKGVIYEFGRFVLDPNERTLLVDGIPLHLPAKEFDTLLLLVEHNGHALTKDEMIAAIWRDSIVEEGNLAKQISRLRKILNTNGERFIETLPKHGYRFSADLRRTLVEPEDDVIFEKRTVKRVTFAIENEAQTEPPLLPPATQKILTGSRIALLLIGVSLLGLAAWWFRREIFAKNAGAVDPYAPVRLTDNPNDDDGPNWTRDGRIMFSRNYPDRHTEQWIMNADGSEQSLVKNPPGKQLVVWSPDEQKMMFLRSNDLTKVYLSNADGSGEALLPFRSCTWSPDSKTLACMKRIAGDDIDIFTYAVETGKILNITNNPALDADPTFSPDGSRIAFNSNRDGNEEIYSMNVDGSDVRRLTFNPGGDDHPAYSPDGTQIVFTTGRGSEDGDIYIMNADGGNPVKLAGWDKTSETVGPGCWSFDGTKVAFFSDRNGHDDDIYVVSAETVRPRLILADPDHDLAAPSYSPDGKSIVYLSELEDRSGELKTFDLQTKTSNVVRKLELGSAAPKWSPDGEWIVFHDRLDGNSEIFAVRRDGSDLRRLTTDPSADIYPAWSPDGGRIVFQSSRGEPLGKPQLYIMNADGSDQHPLTPRKGWEGDPVWAPDGNEIIFDCDRENAPGNMLDICEINADGSDEKHLLYHRDYDINPAISPDGKRIVFASRADGNTELYLMNRDGSGLLRLTRDPATDEFPAWSPDGKKIIFSSNRGGKFAIYEIDV